MPQQWLRNHSVYMACCDLYGAYTDVHNGVFAGPMTSTIAGRATGVSRKMCSGGYNAVGAYLRTAAPRHVEKLPNGSAGSGFRGEQSDLKIVFAVG